MSVERAVSTMTFLDALDLVDRLGQLIASESGGNDSSDGVDVSQRDLAGVERFPDESEPLTGLGGTAKLRCCATRQACVVRSPDAGGGGGVGVVDLVRFDQRCGGDLEAYRGVAEACGFGCEFSCGGVSC